MSNGNAVDFKQSPHHSNRELQHHAMRYPWPNPTLERNTELEQFTRNYTLELTAATPRSRDSVQTQALFISGLAHELRIGINTILNHTGFLLMDGGDGLTADQHEAISQIKTLGKYLQSIMDNVIDISRIEAGYVHACPKVFKIADLVEEAINLISPKAQAKGLAITTDIPHGLTLCSDYKLLLKSLAHCLANAVKYTPRGKIHVAAVANAQWVDLTVQDTGIGIPATELIGLFQAFSLVESHHSYSLSGAGLGLCIIRLLITEVLGGAVSVESTPGAGSTFTLRVADKISI